MYLAGVSFTERAPAIIDRRLRDCSKREAPEHFEPQQWRQQGGYDVQSQRAGDRSRARDAGECLIGRCHESPRKGDALRFVRVEGPIIDAPCNTDASFHARFTASPIPVFMPCPPTGL